MFDFTPPHLRFVKTLSCIMTIFLRQNDGQASSPWRTVLYYALTVRGILLADSAAPECRTPAHGVPRTALLPQ